MPIVKCLKCGLATVRMDPSPGEKCRRTVPQDSPEWPAPCGGALSVTELEARKGPSRQDIIGQNGNDGDHYAAADLYPKYFRDVSQLNEVDVYMVHGLFRVKDDTGAIHHASKKLLLSGQRNGGKSLRQDVKEARDTLNRWLECDEFLSHQNKEVSK